MRGLNVVVLGAGAAGLVTTLALARAGHRVRVVERDRLEQDPSPEAAFLWRRPGVAHFMQPHAFIPRARKEMRTHLPDVYAELLNAGAEEVDLRPKLPGPARPDDEEMAYVGVRRPLLEWALRRATRAQAGVEVCDGVRVTRRSSSREGPAAARGLLMSCPNIVSMRSWSAVSATESSSSCSPSAAEMNLTLGPGMSARH